MGPNQRIVRTYLLRSAGLWLAVRSTSGLVMAFAGFDPLRFTIGASVVVVALSIAVGFVEIGLRRVERAPRALLLDRLAAEPWR